MFKKKNEIDKDGLNDIIFLSKNILKLLFVILIIGIILASVVLCKFLGIFTFIGSLLKVLAPLFIGFVVAWLFAPLVKKLTKKGMPRILASTIVYIILVAFIILFFKLFIPIIYKELNELISALPAIMSKLTDWINDAFSKVDMEGVNVSEIKNTLLTSLSNYGNEISSNLPTTIVNCMTGFASGMGTVFFGLIIGLYMLFDFDNISHMLIRIIPNKHQKSVSNLIQTIGVEVRKSVNGTLLVACMVFVCDTVGFAIVGMDSALLFGLFCGITDLIPYIGPWIGTIVATIVALTESPLIGLGVLIIAIIVQLVESYVLQPIVMSKATNLHPVTIICGLLIFGHFFGIIGMILATPVMSIIKVIWNFAKERFEILHKFNDDVVEEKTSL
jgi:predicted PurR-regulated permease PerM